MKKVLLKVKNGIVYPIKIPADVEVIIHDYDIRDTVENEMVHTDKHGKQYIELAFEDTEYAV